MVFPKQSRSPAFQSAKRSWAEPHREAFVWHARYHSEDLGRNQPRIAGRMSQKNTVVDLCNFMRFDAIMQSRPYKNSFYVGKTYIDFNNLLLSLFILIVRPSAPIINKKPRFQWIAVFFILSRRVIMIIYYTKTY